MTDLESTTNPDPDKTRATVRESYARAATGQRRGSCCGGPTARETSERLGYAPADLDAIPDEANLGLGCGNPTALARLAPGEVVVDLGSGAGIDALIAAPKVGPEGRVIGVDMTPEMLERARVNAVKMGVARHVEFREGTIEDLPVASNSADVVISNCVINLSPDKPRVFREIFRVLKPGGRLAVSDICLTEPLPADVAALAEAYVACVGGAMVERDYVAAIAAAGFVDVRIASRPAASMLESVADDPIVEQVTSKLGLERLRAVAATVRSVQVEARRP